MRNGQPPIMEENEQYYILSIGNTSYCVNYMSPCLDLLMSIVYLITFEFRTLGFLRQWLDYVKKPLQKGRPTEIVNGLLLCEHGGFLFNPDDTTDAENTHDYSVITAKEWAYLQAMYANALSCCHWLW